jgi:hypothetical protein
MRVGLGLLGPFVVLGIASAVYWWWTEQQQAGDLRFYLFVQFYPLLAIPLMLLLFPPRYTGTAAWFVALGWYMFAKVLEVLDVPLFHLIHVVSGHTLKHLAAAMGAYSILRMLRNRHPVSASAGDKVELAMSH